MTPDQTGTNLSKSSQDQSGILRLTLNDPDRCNALSESMLAALADAFEQASDNPVFESDHSWRGWADAFVRAMI